MIVLDVPQRSDAWNTARLGIVTASAFDRILTPSGEPSRQAKAYRNELLAEYLTGRAVPSYSNDWIERGEALEQQARDYYELLTDREIQQVGFVYKDERRLCGCSPDALFDEGGLEIKVLKPGNHIEHLLSEAALPLKYKPQVQGNLYVTGRSYWEWLSYHPEMPPVLVRVGRDEKYLSKLDAAIEEFLADLLAQRQALLDRGLQPLGLKAALEGSLGVLGGAA